MRRIFVAALVVLTVSLMRPHPVGAQSLTTGAIVGVISDPTGAVVTNAEVTVKDIDRGQTRTTITGADGAYVLSQLGPGQYRVTVKADGFKAAQVGPILVGVSRTVNANVSLEVGAQTDMVEVTAAPDLLEPSNPNTTTTVTSQVIAALPNPGNDLTYVAHVAPGAIMNTGGGNSLNGNGPVEFNKGNNNVEFNGLPATSINLTIDGLDGNNLGAINQSMGLNSISEASVNT